MCGIAGLFAWDGDDARDVRTVVDAMTSAMAHRGPDGAGVVVQSAGGTVAGLGHRRLAIIDLSDRAAQPMQSRTAPIWLTFNGEIYNFAEVRRDLESRGCSFRSSSDTEVILQGYEVWGEGVLDRLEGMFAVGIYDGRHGRLLLARDPLGIKPIYFWRNDRSLLFASEVGGLLASGRVDRQLDADALEQYLAFQTAVSPRTLIRNVSMLEPGHVLTVDRAGRVSKRAYWDMLDAPQTTLKTEADARACIDELVARSVEGHLISDVPVGVFLSGGIDSTVIAAHVLRLGRTPDTFSVVMPGMPEDEAEFSRLVARRFDCRHHELPLTEIELADRVPEALNALDYPSGDAVNTFVVSRAVRAAGIKVALSGLGGDELFGGYPSFERLRRLSGYTRLWGQSPAFVRSAAASVVRGVGSPTVAREKAAAVLESDGSWAETFPVLRQVFGRGERDRLLARPSAATAVGEYAQMLARAARREPHPDLMAFVSFAEARTYMHDVLLRDSDQMSMAHGLELRVPLLNRALVDAVMALPETLKQPNGVPKRLLVESLGAAMPPEIVHRPKRGFVLPFDAWMRGRLRPICEHHLGPAGLGRVGAFRDTEVDRLWKSFLSNDGRTTWSRPWTLVALGAWLERHRVAA